jgi:hypothetical protein
MRVIRNSPALASAGLHLIVILVLILARRAWKATAPRTGRKEVRAKPFTGGGAVALPAYLRTECRATRRADRVQVHYEFVAPRRKTGVPLADGHGYPAYVRTAGYAPSTSAEPQHASAKALQLIPMVIAGTWPVRYD